MTLTIPFNSGRIAILSDLHANTYDHRGTDPIASLGLHAVVNDMLDALATAPTTVVHGDYRADNIFFDENNDEIGSRKSVSEEESEGESIDAVSINTKKQNPTMALTCSTLWLQKVT